MPRSPAAPVTGDDVASPPSGAVAAGLVLAGAGLGCLVVLLGPLLARPVLGPTSPWRDLVLPALLLVAVGIGLATDGSYSPATVATLLARPDPPERRWDGPLLVLVGVGGAVAVLAVVRVMRGDLRAATAIAWWAGLVLGVATAALAGWAARRVLARAGPSSLSAEVRSRRLVSIAVMGLVAAQLGVLGTGHDLYPLSPFRMYAAARTADDLAVVGRVEATTADGRIVDLATGIGVATLRTWLERESPSRLQDHGRDLAHRHQRRTGDDLVAFRVLRQRWRVAAYPAPPELEMVDEVVVAEGTP